MWIGWLERVLNAHDDEAYAAQRAQRPTLCAEETCRCAEPGLGSRDEHERAALEDCCV